MLKKLDSRTTKTIIFLVVPAWLICSCSLLKRTREPDPKLLNEFREVGIPLALPYLQAGNLRLHYAKTGKDDRSTLFFIHGSPGSWIAFKRYLMDKDLRERFRIISIDRPGFGYSSFGAAVHLDEQSTLIYKIIQHESNGKPVHLIGHSLGGPIVVKLAQDHPRDLASLTILAGSISPYDEPRESWRKIFATGILRDLLPGALRTSNKEIFYYKKDLYMMDDHYDLLNMPVMFIHGDKDPLVTVRNVEYGMKKLQHNLAADSIIIHGANHFIPWEHFDIIKKYLLTLK